MLGRARVKPSVEGSGKCFQIIIDYVRTERLPSPPLRCQMDKAAIGIGALCGPGTVVGFWVSGQCRIPGRFSTVENILALRWLAAHTRVPYSK